MVYQEQTKAQSRPMPNSAKLKKSLTPEEVDALLTALEDRDGKPEPIYYKTLKIGQAIPIFKDGELSIRIEITDEKH